MSTEIKKNLTKKEIQNYQLLYKCNQFKSKLEQISFMVFFMYDFLSPKDRALLRKVIELNSLQSFILSNKTVKVLLTNPKYNILKNMLKGNTLVVYHTNNEIISKDILKDILNTNKLKLTFGILNKKIYRNSEILKYLDLNDVQIKMDVISKINQSNIQLKHKLFVLKHTI
jgi:ribosomal protein L10